MGLVNVHTWPKKEISSMVTVNGIWKGMNRQILFQEYECKE